MSNQMKALMKEAPGTGLVLTRVPVPEIGPDDVLIRIHKTGICGRLGRAHRAHPAGDGP